MVRFLAGIGNIAADTALPKLVLIGTKETPGIELGGRILEQLLHTVSKQHTPKSAKASVPLATLSLLNHAIGQLTPSKDTPVSSHVYLPLGEHVLSCVVAQLPTAVSRHNSFARPHSISQIVKSNVSDKNETLVGLALPQHEQTRMAAGIAVAKGVSHYNHKSGELSGVIDGENPTQVNVDRVQVVYEEELQEEDVLFLNSTADGVNLAQRLVDAPPNELHTDAYITEAKAVAERTNASITIIQGEDLREQGFGGIYGVGKASLHPPALVCLSHYPNEESKDNKGIALVGKGIVYDTGGLSLKISGNMVGMKRDMGGSAALLGAFEAAVLSGNAGTTHPLHVVLCLAENAVGPLATRPDDVHTLYSGKTVEINNTDAEGRLVLGDGVAYAVKHLNPEVVLDMATLTGAQGIATGNRVAAIVTNSAELEAIAVRAGKASGDLCHPMPYVPEFFRQEFKSAVADMKNSVKNRSNAQVSCAGQFIANHLGDYEANGKWIHVDMAYPVHTDDERATGYGVGLVQGILQQLNA
ncbi:metalloprotease family M17 [Thraustotheca clavata]|uniref:Metalloprotease family M17 n=1 Tax=Thraustotheca clavata TaxID=74557 RepID=A0A1V9ZQP3_9STRA|nr:metalloprotease family M17 [Thraustotheca clavata]